MCCGRGFENACKWDPAKGTQKGCMQAENLQGLAFSYIIAIARVSFLMRGYRSLRATF
jgi:hypothetical protein